MMKLARSIVIAALLLVCVNGQTFGLGVSHLKRFNGHASKAQTQSELQLGEGFRAADDTDDDVTEHYYMQAVVDNFAPVDKHVSWHSGQRYFENKKWWSGVGGPIFVYIGGEGAESARHLTDRMYIYTLAKQHRALLLDLEHRFYGESAPFPNTEVDNLDVLSSEQALADLARFIGNYTAEHDTVQSKVVVFGGSYPGNLAAWFGLKYPHLVSGAIASSAPLQAEEDFSQYMDVVGDALRHWGGDECYEAVEAGATALAALMTGDGRDYVKLDSELRTCSALNSSANVTQDMMVLQSNLMGNLQGTVQYNRESTVMNVTDVCDIMTASKEYLDNFISLQLAYQKEQNVSCVDTSYEEMLSELQNSTWASESRASRMWYYQTCNEFGYFQTTNSPNQPLHAFDLVTTESYNTICESVFGIDRSPAVSWANTMYGGTHVRSNAVLFPQGSLDPWHALGVTDTTKLPPGDESVYIQYTAHCADMSAPRDDAPVELTAAHSTINTAVSHWVVGQPYPPLPSSGDSGMSGGGVFGMVVLGMVLGAAGVGFMWYRERSRQQHEYSQVSGYQGMHA